MVVSIGSYDGSYEPAAPLVRHPAVYAGGLRYDETILTHPKRR
jgi:hypothetical protein